MYFNRTLAQSTLKIPKFFLSEAKLRQEHIFTIYLKQLEGYIIRVTRLYECYENEIWKPNHGVSKHLLPNTTIATDAVGGSQMTVSQLGNLEHGCFQILQMSMYGRLV
jgi:hypothetical protein